MKIIDVFYNENILLLLDSNVLMLFLRRSARLIGSSLTKRH